MTPRPADEARRALREARGRGEPPGTDGDPGATAPPRSPASPPPAPSRPGDMARAALRNARSARRAGAHGPADAVDASSEAPDGRPAEPAAADASGAANASDVPATGPRSAAHPAAASDSADPAGSGDLGPMGESAASAERSARSDDTAEAGGSDGSGGSDGKDGSDGSGDRGVPDGASAPGPEDARAARPADVAREALRAARRQAKADAASERGSANSGAHARGSSRPAGRQRRADGSGTADARARAVRDFAAGAFRLPPEADRTEDAPPTGESAGGSASERSAPDGRATAPTGPDPSPGTDRAAATAGPDRAAGSAPASPEVRATAPPEPDPTPGIDRAAVSASASRARAVVPPEPDPAPAAHHAAGSAPTSPDGRATAPPEPDPSPGVDHAAVTAGADHAAETVDAHRAAGFAATAPGAGHVPAPEGSGGGDEWGRGPWRPSVAARGRGSGSSAPARAPRSMAAPDRDGDLRRTFPALPPREAAAEGFAGTWWGNAWVTALEEGALDAARLERGRGYVERGHVDAITVTPGLVLAYVQGSRARPYRVQVRLRTLGDADWDRFLDAAVERPGHIAALLDKELPHSLADLADHGVPLLPGPGDLTPQCSCPDSGHPCKHAAALCYQTARLLDADPFVLLLLRGRGERALLDALSRRNAAREARAAQDRGPAPLPGVRAGEALTPRALPPLPPPLPAPPHPEQPPAYPAAPGGPDPFALDQLATDAAARAHALLTTGRDPVGGLTLWQDAVRLAAARPGSGLTAGTRALYASLASAAGRDTAELARAVAAWRQGGPDGLDVLEEPWDPPAGRFDRARPLLLAADLPAFRPWRNRLTHPRGHVQLRLGRTGLWYAYESEPGREDWWPRGTPDLDPVGALTGLGTRVDL